jgi:hypothetical protein
MKAMRLKNGRIAPLEDITGLRFGRLLVLRRYEKTARHGWKYECQCDCGNLKIVLQENLCKGQTSSCGCLHSQTFRSITTTHGMSKTPLYKSWSSMIRRCKKTSGKDASRYANRGIRVCERWKIFENFLDDMGPTWKRGYSIERKNNDGNYEPSNCRWATAQEQARNRSTNHQITYNNETHLISEWAEMAHVSIGQIINRQKSGWTFGQAIECEPKPYHGGRPKKKVA